MIAFSCPHCGKGLRVPAKYAGRQGKCNGCGRVIVAPNISAQGTASSQPEPSSLATKSTTVEEKPASSYDDAPMAGADRRLVAAAIAFLVLVPLWRISLPVVQALIRLDDGLTRGQQRDLFVFGVAAVYIVFFAYVGVTFYVMAIKTGTRRAWWAWVPYVNTFLAVAIAEKPMWWGAVMFATVALPFSGLLPYPLSALVAVILIGIPLALAVLTLCEISKKLGKPWGLGFLIFVPLAGLFLPAYLAIYGRRRDEDEEPIRLPRDYRLVASLAMVHGGILLIGPAVPIANAFFQLEQVRVAEIVRSLPPVFLAILLFAGGLAMLERREWAHKAIYVSLAGLLIISWNALSNAWDLLRTVGYYYSWYDLLPSGVWGTINLAVAGLLIITVRRYEQLVIPMPSVETSKL